MAFQISAGVGNQREAGSVGFWKSVECEGSDGEHDLLLRFLRDAIALHAGAELGLDFLHSFFRALESHGAAQFFSLATGESCDDHGHAQKLLLEKWDTQGAFKHR